MIPLIRVELAKARIWHFLRDVLIANIIMAVFAFLILDNSNESSTSLAVVEIITKIVFVIWQAILISDLIIGEIQSRTITLLLSYPYQRSQLLGAKVVVVAILTIIGSLVTLALLNTVFFILSQTAMPEITHGLTVDAIGSAILTTLAAVALGMAPLLVGIWKKQPVATVVTGVIIATIINNRNDEAPVPLSDMLGIMALLAAVGLVTVLLSLKLFQKQEDF